MARPDDAGFDLSELERLTAGRLGVVYEMLHDLLEANRDDLRRLCECVQAQDQVAIAALAHRIKGGVRLIRAQAVIEACQELEDVCAKAAGMSSEVMRRASRLGFAVLRLEVRLRRHQARQRPPAG